MFCGMAILGISTVSKTQKQQIKKIIKKKKRKLRNIIKLNQGMPLSSLSLIVLQLLLRGNNLGSSAASRGNWLKKSLVALFCFIH